MQDRIAGVVSTCTHRVVDPCSGVTEGVMVGIQVQAGGWRRSEEPGRSLTSSVKLLN